MGSLVIMTTTMLSSAPLGSDQGVVPPDGGLQSSVPLVIDSPIEILQLQVANDLGPL